MSLPTVQYNGTAPDGGDSRKYSTRNVLQCSDDQPQSLVHHWRRSMDIDFDCPSLAHDSRGWILLLGSCPKKVGAFAHLAFSDVNSDCIVPGITYIFTLINADVISGFSVGYSLAFSRTANKFIGNFDNIGFRGVLAQKTGNVPDLTWAIYQGMFAAITPALAIGAAAERGRMLPCCVFIFIWTTIVYDPIACWTWNPNGWVYRLRRSRFRRRYTCTHLFGCCCSRIFDPVGQAS